MQCWQCELFQSKNPLTGDSYGGQKRMIEAATRWCQEFNMHVHFVCHMRKGSKEAQEEDMKDYIKGSSSISDLAFNVISMQPNYDKRAERDMAFKAHEHEEDVKLYISKQRNGTGWTGKIKLWYLWEFLSYCDSEAKRLPAMETETPFED